MNKRFKAVSTVLIVVFILSIGMLLMPAVVDAAAGPKNVRGYVWDNAGRPIEGASVSVTVKTSADVPTTNSTTTNSAGFYSVSFGPSYWDVGKKINVTATYNANQQTNSTTAIDYPVQFVNVTFPFEIPVFDSIWGFAIAGGALAVVGVALLAWKKK